MNFSLHIGLGWHAKGDSRTSFRAGYGVYYSRMLLPADSLQRSRRLSVKPRHQQQRHPQVCVLRDSDSEVAESVASVALFVETRNQERQNVQRFCSGWRVQSLQSWELSRPRTNPVLDGRRGLDTDTPLPTFGQLEDVPGTTMNAIPAFANIMAALAALSATAAAATAIPTLNIARRK